MALRIVRLGSPRGDNEGLRIGTVRRPPRGVKKETYASGNWYDVWLPELAPSAELVSAAHSGLASGEQWKKFERAYRREMAAAPAQRLLALLAAMSRQTNLSVGCYCEDESRCHRLILRQLLVEAGAQLAV